MSDAQIQAIKDVIEMTTRVNIKCLNYVRDLMEKAIDSELLELEPSIILENMDITEKVAYLDYLTETEEERKNQIKGIVSFEEIIERGGLTISDLQDKN